MLYLQMGLLLKYIYSGTKGVTLIAKNFRPTYNF